MKKILALGLTLLFISTNSCWAATSELYYVKNTTENATKPLVEEAYSDYNYDIQKYNPYYGLSRKNNGDYAVVILQQSGGNLFYYYQSNGSNKINKRILKNFKNEGLVYERSYNPTTIYVYDDLAQRTMSNQPQNNYVFSDNTQNTYSVSNTNSEYNASQSSNALKGYVAQVAKGTKIQAYLQNSVNTSSAAVGDQVVAVLTADLAYNGTVIAPQGSLLYGTLSYARHATYGSRNGRVIINFNQLVTPDSKTYNISTEEVDFTVSNDGKIKTVASNAVVGAVVGGLAGLLIGAMTGNVGASAAIGAGVGAGGALVGGAAERGVDAEIPSFTELEITLTKPFSVTVSY